MPLPEFLEIIKKNPEIAELVPQWFQRPRGAVKRTVEALCVNHAVTVDEHGEVIGLPTNKQIAKQLGISEHTVRKYIEVEAALKVQHLEELSARSRVYLCDRWDRVLYPHLYPRRTPPGGVSRVA